MKKILEMVDAYTSGVTNLEKFEYIDKLAAALEERMTSLLEEQDVTD